MITNQQVLNTVVTNLRKQGERSFDIDFEGREVCLYRGPNGVKCAAGHLMPDKLYDKSWERQAICDLIHDYTYEELFGDDVEDITLVEELQNIHDSYDVEEWEEYWKELADKWELVLP